MDPGPGQVFDVHSNPLGPASQDPIRALPEANGAHISATHEPRGSTSHVDIDPAAHIARGQPLHPARDSGTNQFANRDSVNPTTFRRNDMSDQDTSLGTLTRKLGRPRKGDGPAFPSEEVDRLLVFGDVLQDDDGTSRVSYPSYRDLGERFNVAHSLIARYSTQHNCLARRKNAQDRVRQIADTRIVEKRAQDLVVSREHQVRIIDQYLDGFEKAVGEGRVRYDNPGDFNTLCRLRAFLSGEADSRSEVLGGMPTLEDLQRLHREATERWEQTSPSDRAELPEEMYGFDGAARSRGEERRAPTPDLDGVNHDDDGADDPDDDDADADDDDGPVVAHPAPHHRTAEA